MKISRHLLQFATLLLIGFLAATSPTRAQQVVILHNFGDTNDGAFPLAGLVQGSDGNFYGTTTAGSTTGSQGAVYQMTPGGSVMVIHNFTASEGEEVQGIIQGPDNYLYGLTREGGSSNNGTVYKMSTTGAITVLHNFSDGTIVGDGANPLGNLLHGNNNTYYGTTSTGNAGGTVFQIGSSGNCTILHSFVNEEGLKPSAGVTADGDGNLYSTTSQAGPFNNAGTAFKVSFANGTTSFSVIYNFGSHAHDGSTCLAPLLFATDGNFYGTTLNGGLNGDGTVFKLTTGGSETVLYNFSGTDGLQPQGGLIQATDGNFYGTTPDGGASGAGVVYSLTPGGSYTLIHSFGDTAANDGAFPFCNLVQGNDGNLYGTTKLGGAHHDGTIFEVLTGLPTGYPAWVAKYSLTGNNALPTAVLQPDGLANIIKYSLGLSATVNYNPGSPGLPVVQIQNISGNNYLTMSFSGVAFDVTYKVQASSDLSSWTDIYTHAGVTGSATAQDTQDTTVSDRRFLRLQVIYPSP